jgi:uncharacterized C2H2 Zn-finger protein
MATKAEAIRCPVCGQTFTDSKSYSEHVDLSHYPPSGDKTSLR